jgi:carboxyl-terminal processing protease
VVELDRLLEQPGRESLGVFKLTIEQYFRVTGGSVQWKGVTPDIVLPDPAAFVESGERTLDHSIPWTAVDPLPFTRHAHAWGISELSKASRTRIGQNPLFSKIDGFNKLIEARRKDTTESLKLDTWSADKKRDKTALEAADPKLKDQKPIIEVSVLGETAPPAAPPGDKKGRQKLDTWKDELARDPWVAESLQVLADMAAKKK